MQYTLEHAAQALEIMQRLLPHVPPRPEYIELVSILQKPERWKEAHAHFNKIRVNITLPNGSHKWSKPEDIFTCLAENAAKTAYNCSGEPAPFDIDSFERLLRCEKQFLEAKHKNG